MALIVFENNKPYVIDEFRQGRFDYLELASDVAETIFFQFLFGRGLVDKLARNYPSPQWRQAPADRRYTSVFASVTPSQSPFFGMVQRQVAVGTIFVVETRRSVFRDKLVILNDIMHSLELHADWFHCRTEGSESAKTLHGGAQNATEIVPSELTQ